MNRFIKQLIIGLVFIIVISAIGFGGYNIFRVKPTCFDNIQNGEEEGVDCGTLACASPCAPEIQPLQIISSQVIKITQGDYDFVAKVYNPNTDYGSSLVSYDLAITTGTDTKTNSAGNFYILPGQTKSLVWSSLKNGNGINDIKLNINNVLWEKLGSFSDAGFVVRARDYKVLNKNNVFSELSASVFNNSNYDFDKVDIAVILFDNSGEIVGVNRTEISTFLSQTTRDFKVEWPYSLSSEVTSTDIEINTNFFNNSNFIKSHGIQEKFQKYY